MSKPDVAESNRASTMAEIDTAAPFASVRDAVNMFGEHVSPAKSPRIFPTVNTVNAEKIVSLETELQQTREELGKMQSQLATAESKAAIALKELSEMKYLLGGSTKKPDNTSGTDVSSWEAQLDATLEQQAGVTSPFEREMEKISNLQAMLEGSKTEHESTLSALTRIQEQNDRLKEAMMYDAIPLAETREQDGHEQNELAAHGIDELMTDLKTTKDLLTKANIAREEAERELQITRDAESQRVKSAASTAAGEVEKLRNELKDAEEKQEQIIAAVEKLRDELTTTKEAERRACRAESEANLQLQRMKIEVEDAELAKEKARAMATQLEEYTATFKGTEEEERRLLASLASLKAELKNANNQLVNLKKEAEDSSAEMDEQLNRLQADLEAAVAGEARANESVFRLNEGFQKVTTEANEARSAAAQAKQEAYARKQELEQALAHSSTLESRLLAAIKETEAARAAEAVAVAEVESLKKRVTSDTDVQQDGAEITLSHDEYETMKKKVLDADDLANKRVAAALAQVEAAKASELETLTKMEAAKHLIDSSQAAMKQAIQIAEAAEAAKSAVEGELRKWRSENEQRRKAAVAAVFQGVGTNGVAQNGSPPSTNQKGGILNRKGVSFTMKSNRRSQSPSLSPSTPQSGDLVQQFSFGDEKAKKNLFSTKLGSYFTKKVK